MHKLTVYVRCENGCRCDSALRERIRRCATAALRAEGVPGRCELSVLLTDGEGIRAINREYREVDAVTDVLSFPMGETDPESGRLVLGDMVLNMDRIRSQAAELGHSTERETAYLTVHSVLHLLGYDHVDEGEQKRLMRSREKAIMEVLTDD